MDPHEDFRSDGDAAARQVEWRKKWKLACLELLQRKPPAIIPGPKPHARDRAVARLREEYERTGQLHPFTDIYEFVCGNRDAGEYKVVAAELHVSATALRVVVFRLRQRLRELLREEGGDWTTL